MEQLQLLNLSSNALSGTLPPGWKNFGVVRVLDFSRNKLVGGFAGCVGELGSARKHVSWGVGGRKREEGWCWKGKRVGAGDAGSGRGR